jgi:mannose-6-phosphate isomerase-like protein (cupin superfamily)
MNRFGISACLLAFAAVGNVASAQSITTPKSTKWGPAPASLPAGASAAVLDGDPSKSGPFTLRLMFPPGYRIPPHFHPADEHVTVISGHLNVGMGDQFDKKKGTALHAGAFGVLPAEMHHFAWASGRTVIQLNGMGPWKLTYVNPADTPKPR